MPIALDSRVINVEGMVMPSTHWECGILIYRTGLEPYKPGANWECGILI